MAEPVEVVVEAQELEVREVPKAEEEKPKKDEMLKGLDFTIGMSKNAIQ